MKYQKITIFLFSASVLTLAVLFYAEHHKVTCAEAGTCTSDFIQSCRVCLAESHYVGAICPAPVNPDFKCTNWVGPDSDPVSWSENVEFVDFSDVGEAKFCWAVKLECN